MRLTMGCRSSSPKLYTSSPSSAANEMSTAKAYNKGTEQCLSKRRVTNHQSGRYVRAEPDYLSQLLAPHLAELLRKGVLGHIGQVHERSSVVHRVQKETQCKH